MPSSGRVRTVGKTPVMAFVLDYLREFPGAGYGRVKAAAQAAQMGVPATIVYGNALRVIKKERAPEGEAPAPRRPSSRGRGRSVADLAGFIDEFRAVVAERDRLRDVLEGIAKVLKTIRPRRVSPTIARIANESESPLS